MSATASSNRWATLLSTSFKTVAVGFLWLSLAAHGAVLSGCALEDGQPWGQAELALDVGFSPPDARLTEAGQLLTNTDYAIRLDRLEIAVEGLAVTIGGEGSQASFDPANPPDGYELCHNGHCHDKEGNLVSYDEIAASLATGGSGGTVVTQPVTPTALSLSQEPVAAPLESCPDQCQLPRGEVVSVGVAVHQLEVEGVVFDTGPSLRIPAEGVAFSGTIEIEGAVDVALNEKIGPGEEVGLGVSLHLPVTDRLFDGIDWSARGDGPLDLNALPELQSTIRENLLEHTVLEAAVRRF